MKAPTGNGSVYERARRERAVADAVHIMGAGKSQARVGVIGVCACMGLVDGSNFPANHSRHCALKMALWVPSNQTVTAGPLKRFTSRHICIIHSNC